MHPVAAVGDAWKSRVSPETDIPADGKQTLTAALPVAKYWQKRHQQKPRVIGSARLR